MIDITQHEAVTVLRWCDGENRINLDSLAALSGAIDDIAQSTGPLALVLTGEGKFFSNGLDLGRFADDPDQFLATIIELDHLFARLLEFPAYVVGAINGHCFAGGAMIASTVDYRIMRSDRGFWCVNEAELSLPLSPTMAATLRARLPDATIIEAISTARRYSGADALAAGIVHEIAEDAEVLERAIAKAADVATKDRKVIANLKSQVFGELAARLRAS
jgi:enoyl-CoA hydratase/carnithine racemase